MNQTASQSRRPIRVLMYTAYFDPEYSGAALQALTLARVLRQRGHHIEFVTNRWPGLAASAVVEDFAVHRMEPGRWRKHREFRLWFNLAALVWHKRRDFDILHSHGAYYSCAFIGPLGRLAGLKSLVKASLANDDLQDLSRPVIGHLHRLMLRRIDAYVAISRDLAEEFRQGGLAPERIHHLPNGVDTEFFRPAPAQEVAAIRARLGLPGERPVALYVGVLDQRKNIQWLAERWIEHQAFGTGALLVAVGPQSREDPDGALRNQLLALAKAHPHLFELRDFHPDIRPYYQCANLLLLPSVKEGLPNVVLEAMASGLPCVAARASGSRELIVEGETGYTYAFDALDELAEATRRCLSPAGAAMAANARRLAQTCYAIQAIADQYEVIYGALLARA